MRSRRQFALFVITLAAFIARNPGAVAQTGLTTAGGAAADQRATGAGAPPARTSTTAVHARDQSDQTLEIAPRIPPSRPATQPPSGPDSGANLNDAASPPDGAKAATQPPAAANSDRPYLGLAVQTIYSNDRPSGLVTGLEVVSVDRNSPAAIAGLRGRTKMTSIGESGATAGALVPPLNLFVMPLLKKTGSLGQGGDLIVAIDDRRVANDFDLQSELESLKPGDVIYLTIMRARNDGSQQTLKLPIKLGDASKAVANAGDADDMQPSASSTDSPPQLPWFDLNVLKSTRP